MGSSQSMRKQPQSTTITKIPLENLRYDKKANLQSTSENPLQFNQSVSSDTSQKETPLKTVKGTDNTPQSQSSWNTEPIQRKCIHQHLDKLDFRFSDQGSPGIKKFTQNQQRQTFKIKFNLKKTTDIKIAVVGARSAVGKTTVVTTFNKQSIEEEIKQTLGTDVQFAEMDLDDTMRLRIQFWEFESNDQSLDQWKSRMNNKQFDGIILVFDEFGEECAEKIRDRILILQKIQSQGNHHPIITLVGNDRLNMMITGKESDIQRCLSKLTKGDQINVKITDFKQLKEVNNLFRSIFEKILKAQNNSQ